jgi:hypothetical protein
MMGEMADYTLEQLKSEPWYPDGIEHSDYFANIMYDEEAGIYEGPFSSSAGKTCRCCGRAGLYWKKRLGKWRLHDGRGVHRCPQNPLTE